MAQAVAIGNPGTKGGRRSRASRTFLGSHAHVVDSSARALTVRLAGDQVRRERPLSHPLETDAQPGPMIAGAER